MTERLKQCKKKVKNKKYNVKATFSDRTQFRPRGELPEFRESSTLISDGASGAG